MVVSIPTFRLKVSEGLVDSDTSADRLFGYCVEAPKGPVLEPTFVASATEAQEIFGVNFAPHFYQKPTGVVICRVGFDGAKKAKFTWQVNIDDKPVDAVTIEAINPGPVDHSVRIAHSSTNSSAYNLYVSIDGVISKKYQSLPDLASCVKRINSKFGNYLHATLNLTSEELKKVTPADLIETETVNGEESAIEGKLDGGIVGIYCLNNGLPPMVKVGAVDEAGNPIPDKDNQVQIDAIATTDVAGQEGYSPNYKVITGSSVDMDEGKNKSTDPNALYPDANATLLRAYRKAFEVMKSVDLLGIATLSRAEVVQNELIEHITEMNDPEVAQLRLGVTGFLDYPENAADRVLRPVGEVEAICEKAREINNEYIIYIGQGVVFEEEGVRRNLYPYEAVQLYTGMRSSLGYSEAIFGGEPKKVLTGVVDTLPITTTDTILVKEDREDLNEAGVTTFKKEYDEVTFLEGVTTVQDHDVLSYESIMNIVIYVTKRLINVAKPYQGRALTEDLKATLETALSSELKTITDTDKTLIALEEYNIPPYDVEVKSAAMAKFDDSGNLVRESKIIIKAKIVPVGALRDIDLGVIII